MTVVLTAMNRFINEADGSQTAFLDGNQPDRLCAPMAAHVEARGGEVRVGAPVREIVVDPASGRVQKLRLGDGSEVVADMYVSAAPVDIFKKMMPPAWSSEPFFASCRALRGIPVINVHLWFDRKLATSLDGLAFSRSPLLSVYADMSRSCAEYADDERSMLELVFAPCSKLAGGDTNWIGKSDEEIIDATMGELARLFPTEIANDERWPATSKQTPQGQARLRKFAVVKVRVRSAAHVLLPMEGGPHTTCMLRRCRARSTLPSPAATSTARRKRRPSRASPSPATGPRRSSLARWRARCWRASWRRRWWRTGRRASRPRG